MPTPRCWEATNTPQRWRELEETSRKLDAQTLSHMSPSTNARSTRRKAISRSRPSKRCFLALPFLRTLSASHRFLLLHSLYHIHSLSVSSRRALLLHPSYFIFPSSLSARSVFFVSVFRFRIDCCHTQILTRARTCAQVFNATKTRAIGASQKAGGRKTRKK